MQEVGDWRARQRIQRLVPATASPGLEGKRSKVLSLEPGPGVTWQSRNRSRPFRGCWSVCGAAATVGTLPKLERGENPASPCLLPSSILIVLPFSQVQPTSKWSHQGLASCNTKRSGGGAGEPGLRADRFRTCTWFSCHLCIFFFKGRKETSTLKCCVHKDILAHRGWAWTLLPPCQALDGRLLGQKSH